MINKFILIGLFLLCQLASLFCALWMLIAILVGSPRAWRLAISYDQLFNAATGGGEDETVSSRANRAKSENRRWGCVLCKLLDWVEKDHCRKSEGA